MKNYKKVLIEIAVLFLVILGFTLFELFKAYHLHSVFKLFLLIFVMNLVFVGIGAGTFYLFSVRTKKQTPMQKIEDKSEPVL
jgi:hypothetical protein